MENFNREENFNNEKKDSINLLFEEFYKKHIQIIELVNSIVTDDGFATLHDLTIHKSKNNDSDIVLIQLDELDQMIDGVKYIYLNSYLDKKEIQKNGNFILRLGALTDIEAFERMQKDNIDTNNMKDLHTYYNFDNLGNGSKIIILDKNLGISKYFPNTTYKSEDTINKYVYLKSEFNGGDLELVDFSLFKLKEELIREIGGINGKI